ncbi:MAG: carboxypeptidase-like regulatory domain-containing protein [Melioribacteraceae bacterium]
MQKYSLIYISILLIFIANCNAPHNNPLDPENSENKISVIDGYIKTVKIPQIPIEDVSIFWVNEGIITNSNESGYFKIENLERNDGWLVVEKIGYSTDSIFVSFNQQKKVSQNIFLNAIPVIEDLKFYSITINRFPSGQKYNLEVKAKINDEENDVDSVFIENEELDISKQLLYNASTKIYENSITLEDLKITSIDIVIGKEFFINVLDANSKKFEIGKTNIKRIIKEEITAISPIGKDTVDSPNPLLAWNRFKPGFDFKYLVEIYTDEISPILVWQSEVYSADIQFQTNANLLTGEYFWVIWAIDEFENRTRSKPSSFIIK